MVPRFRCWDKDSKVMRSWKDLILTKDDGDDFWLIGYKENSCITSFDHDQILMQSTGLKDKNGVEIFEGDLVKKFLNINKFTDDFAEDIEPVYAITSIVRDGACFKTTFKGAPSLVVNENSGSMAKHMEVVGNIYENPELLEQANES